MPPSTIVIYIMAVGYIIQVFCIKFWIVKHVLSMYISKTYWCIMYDIIILCILCIRGKTDMAKYIYLTVLPQYGWNNGEKRLLIKQYAPFLTIIDIWRWTLSKLPVFILNR